jgi:signal transduction histidine kinase
MSKQRKAEVDAELARYHALRPFIAESLTLNHEINNPLTGILGYAEYLLADAGELTPDQRSSLEQMAECAERISEIVARLSELKMQVAKEIDIEEFVAAHRTDRPGSE